MARDDELDRLSAEQERAFQRKQDALAEQDRAWERRKAAREVLERPYQEKQDAYEEQQEAWEELQRVRDRNGPRIDRLNDEQEAAFQNMKDAFERASAAHDARDGASARAYADDGHRYKAEAQAAVAERRQLVQEIRDAKARHEATRAPFQRAKAAFDRARDEHHGAKAHHERARDEYKRTKADFQSAKDAFQDRLAIVRAERQQRKDDKRSIAERAGVPYQYRDDVYISTEPDGTVNIYFGGVGSPEGPGHGHYVMDSTGNVTYTRDPSDEHGARNFADYEERRSTAFADRPKQRDPSRHDIWFSPEGEFEKDESGARLYGHVAETRHDDGNRTYHYVRDEDENVYIDDALDDDK